MRPAQVILAAITLLSLGCNVQKDRVDSEKTAERIHSQQKTQDFQSIYRESGDSFKKEGDESKFIAAMRQTYDATGPLKNATAIAYQSGFDSNVGAKHVLIFDLEFERGHGKETLTLTRSKSGEMQLWNIVIEPIDSGVANEKALLAPITINEVFPEVLRNGKPDPIAVPVNQFNEKDLNNTYMATDTYEKYAWLKIDGQILILKLAAAKSQKVISYLKEKAGDHFRLVYSGSGVEAVAEYLVTMVGHADDCVRIGYTVRLTVTKDKRAQSLTILNERGC